MKVTPYGLKISLSFGSPIADFASCWRCKTRLDSGSSQAVALRLHPGLLSPALTGSEFGGRMPAEFHTFPKAFRLRC